MFYDTLTAYPNRNIVSEHVNELLAVACSEERILTLVYMDTVNLKEVNDTLGHDMGDLLLQEVSRRLKAVVREMDVQGHSKSASAGMMARITGGEFVLAFFASDDDAVTSLMSRINRGISSPFRVGEIALSVRMRYGVVRAPHDGDNYETLMRHASLALGQAKERSNTICFYDSNFGRKIKERTYMAHRLESALQQDEGLELRFQPQVELASGELCGVEVLLRWKDDRLGWVEPNLFIPLAEQRGLIGLITRKVLRMASRQCRIWRDRALLQRGWGNIKLAINVSARDLDDQGFADDLLRVIKEEGVAPENFEIELTETGLMHEPQDAIRMLNDFKNQGFSLAIDDFGTGHSSMYYLRDIAADSLKIDMSFVRDFHENPANRAIIKTMIDTANIFGMKTVAEGVEDRGVAEQLERMGCNHGQGYHYARPLTAEAFEREWLSSPCAD